MPEQTALSDREALDQLALFMAHPGQWNGGDVCEVAAELITATGRPNFDFTAADGEDGDEPHPAYVTALAAFHTATPNEAIAAAARNLLAVLDAQVPSNLVHWAVEDSRRNTTNLARLAEAGTVVRAVKP